jgi:hypothetical protein
VRGNGAARLFVGETDHWQIHQVSPRPDRTTCGAHQQAGRAFFLEIIGILVIVRWPFAMASFVHTASRTSHIGE